MIAQRIVDGITGDALEPRTRLAGERDMMARFSAGRGTLREALRFLELTGAITVTAGPRGGPVVMRPDGTDLAGVLGLFPQLRTVSFRSVIQVRELLEPELAVRWRDIAPWCPAPGVRSEVRRVVPGSRRRSWPRRTGAGRRSRLRSNSDVAFVGVQVCGALRAELLVGERREPAFDLVSQDEYVGVQCLWSRG
ncbi:GntR family transcriptional regulator [Pseudonocardia sp. NPDC049154]|uniref:FadR/GntR family transcriptional regulator n=1 Tax=Pseudonocardia sp. NPDC049154 TaxID=3155501 RepID=UPI0033F69821